MTIWWSDCALSMALLVWRGTGCGLASSIYVHVDVCMYYYIYMYMSVYKPLKTAKII